MTATRSHTGKPAEQALRRIRAYLGVVIAMVTGSARGGAVDLAMSCDLVVADSNARFAMTPANIGFPYTTSGLLRFFNNLPIHVLKEMFFSAQPLDAVRAEHLSVVNRLVDSDKLEPTAFELARGVASKASLAIQAVKEQLRILKDLQPMPVQTMEQIAELRRQACESADLQRGGGRVIGDATGHVWGKVDDRKEVRCRLRVCQKSIFTRCNLSSDSGDERDEAVRSRRQSHTKLSLPRSN
jgi:enoyl-CoA hydratase/carnithine racemase